MDNFFINKMGMERAKNNKLSINIDKVTNIKYPLKPIQITDPKTPNIFIFGIDALRSDIVQADITPSIEKFSQDSINFKYNISGGNCTRFGIFSIFYGINSSYWFGFLDAKKGSVLFDVLNKLNYQTSIISSVNLNWPEFRKTTFNNVQDKIKDNFEGNVLENDEQTIVYFKEWLNKQDLKKPIFSFVWLDGVHARGYTDKYKKFKPDDATNDYLTINQTERIKQFNRYKNSSLCADAKFGNFIQILKEKGIYQNSIIILLSDHGQEFYEYGFYGHNSAYDFKQVGSPLIIHMPNIKPHKVNYMTSHLDIVPTLMKQLGVTNSISDYAHGKDLFDHAYTRECTFIGNWNENAIVCNKYTVIISDIVSKSFSNEIRDSKTYKLLKDYNKSYINKIIIKTLNENKRFSK
jgi:membrane-anchored protein YejM (alkaline phosphatase superfamily)